MNKITDELIFEKLSVSDDVLRETDNVKCAILSKLGDEDGDFITLCNGIKCLVKMLNFMLEEPIFGKLRKIEVNYYDFEELSDYRNSYFVLPFGGNYYYNQNMLKIVFFGVKGKPNLKFLDYILSHEVHHVFQNFMLDGNLRIGNLYKNAVKNMDGSNRESKDPVVIISNMIYFFDKKEVEANMESFYEELKNRGGEMQNNSVMQSYEYLKKQLPFLKDYLFDDEVKKRVISKFNEPLEKILNYLNNAINYFDRKKRKVIARYENEKNIINEKRDNFLRLCNF